MPSAVATGSYYQGRTRRYLIGLGFVVEPLQLYGWIKTTRGLRPMKPDAFASDLLAVSAQKTVFCQVKGGASRAKLAAARAAFAKYPLAPGEEQWIVTWAPRARQPEVYVVAVGPCAAAHPVIVPPRKKPRPLPLFARTG